MSVFIYANPGQDVVLSLQTVDATGLRANSSPAPNIDSIYNPALQLQSGFPTAMSNLETGLWSFTFQISDGLSALGTYTITASWDHPSTSVKQYEVFSVHVVQPFGVTSVGAS